MQTIEEAIDNILEKAEEYLATKPTNMYVHGFDVCFQMSPQLAEELVETFNKGDAGKITTVTHDSGYAYISWAPDQEKLNHRESQR